MNNTTPSNENAAPHVVLPVDLRDYFAAKAMQALIQRIPMAGEEQAQQAYKIASVMLKERAK